jgi:hypothetical protein
MKPFEIRMKETCPKLYSGLGVHWTEEEGGMLSGIDVGEGWFPIIEELSLALEQINNSLPPEEPPIRAAQIKEKFGYLRFYTDGNLSPAAENAITIAEDRSRVTCEMCGVEEEDVSLPDYRGWMKNLCPACHTKRKVNLSSREWIKIP